MERGRHMTAAAIKAMSRWWRGGGTAIATTVYATYGVDEGGTYTATRIGTVEARERTAEVRYARRCIAVRGHHSAIDNDAGIQRCPLGKREKWYQSVAVANNNKDVASVRPGATPSTSDCSLTEGRIG
jgi:hypothetical protein